MPSGPIPIPDLNLTDASSFTVTPIFNPATSDRNYINVAPTGLNLGEILKNLATGDPANGGAGAVGLEKFLFAGDSQKPSLPFMMAGTQEVVTANQSRSASVASVPPWLLIGGIALAAVLLLR